ncbi:hypothetical protein TNIN_387691 [Trichonephila inaurata madagascariensis]|uniref:Uncharacterized protein n=1 Tax=Trichonephila inaurata madagascariensis TaxID=2747483 RepID=A0A8X7BQS9_9ARAC|nr:hypothetical protein TNIN_387691 [Trichonephila inaurata madagascariensis]
MGPPSPEGPSERFRAIYLRGEHESKNADISTPFRGFRNHMPCCVKQNIPEICRSKILGTMVLTTVLKIPLYGP